MELNGLGGLNTNFGTHSLAVRMEAGVGEALALVLPEESTVAQDNVVDLVSGALAIQPVPFLRTLLTLPVDGIHREKCLGLGSCEMQGSRLSCCPN